MYAASAPVLCSPEQLLPDATLYMYFAQNSDAQHDGKAVQTKPATLSNQLGVKTPYPAILVVVPYPDIGLAYNRLS